MQTEKGGYSVRHPQRWPQRATPGTPKPCWDLQTRTWALMGLLILKAANCPNPNCIPQTRLRRHEVELASGMDWDPTENTPLHLIPTGGLVQPKVMLVQNGLGAPTNKLRLQCWHELMRQPPREVPWQERQARTLQSCSSELASASKSTKAPIYSWYESICRFTNTFVCVTGMS